jgi:hypothetical protein
MTHVTCPGCQLRFARAAAEGAALKGCCGGSLATVAAHTTVGYQLVEVVVPFDALPDARVDALPHPPRGPRPLEL